MNIKLHDLYSGMSKHDGLYKDSAEHLELKSNQLLQTYIFSLCVHSLWKQKYFYYRF